METYINIIKYIFCMQDAIRTISMISNINLEKFKILMSIKCCKIYSECEGYKTINYAILYFLALR